LFNSAEVEGGAVFLKDTQWDAYCFRPWHMISKSEVLQVVKGITTALVFWDKRAIDWDFLEWFLGATELHHISEWIMPTVQAGLANRCKAKTISSRQIPNLYPNAQIFDDTIGVHLLGSYRKEWLKKINKNENKQADQRIPIVPCFESCVRQNVVGYSLKQLRRWKNTRLKIW